MLVYKKLPLLIQTYISLLLKYLYLLSCYIHFILCERNYLETPSAAEITRVLNRRVIGGSLMLNILFVLLLDEESQYRPNKAIF